MLLNRKNFVIWRTAVRTAKKGNFLNLLHINQTLLLRYMLWMILQKNRLFVIIGGGSASKVNNFMLNVFYVKLLLRSTASMGNTFYVQHLQRAKPSIKDHQILKAAHSLCNKLGQHLLRATPSMCNTF